MILTRTLLALLLLTGLVRASEEEVIGLAPAAAYSHADATARLLELGRDHNEVMTHLRVLTKDIGPRMTSSQGLIEAQAWARDTFRRWGLDARLEEWGEFPVGFDRGPSRGRLTVSGLEGGAESLELEFITHAWTAGTNGPVLGNALLEPISIEAVDALAPQLAGAWLVRRKGDEQSREVRSYLKEKCDEMGIAGSVRSGPKSGLLVTGGGHNIEWDDLPTDVSVTLLADHYNTLLEHLEADHAVELEFDIQNIFRKGPIKQHNVVADIRGTEFPDEYVIVQAHIDSWDGAEGAADNGTGTSITMEVARMMMKAGVKPRRTIRFVLYSGEEQGLYGSKGYVETHKDEHDKISVVLNHDNGTRAVGGIAYTEPMRADFEHCFREVLELDDEYEFELKVVEGLRPGPSDHAPFVSAGIPGFFWAQSEDGYTKIHHTQHDTYEETDAAALRYSVMVVALAAHNFAELDHVLDRTDMVAPQPRRMGVYLDRSGVGIAGDPTVDSRAHAAGWQKGDTVVSVDGVEVTNRRELTRELRGGEPRKVFVIRRGEELIETVLDWTEDPDEPRRVAAAAKAAAAKEIRDAKRAAARAERKAEKAAAKNDE